MKFKKPASFNRGRRGDKCPHCAHTMRFTGIPNPNDKNRWQYCQHCKRTIRMEKA